jgi:hypothetical protein
MGLRPQALYVIAESPVGIAGYLVDHDARSLAMISRAFDGRPEGLTPEDVLDKVTLTWLTSLFVCGAEALHGRNTRRVPVAAPLDEMEVEARAIICGFQASKSRKGG